MQLKELVDRIYSEFVNKDEIFEPFIRYIRFPKFKNFRKDVKINFDFPISILIGENGSNKSSLIRALYGAPAQKSLGEYWFESNVDQIKDNAASPSCFIYGYWNPYGNKIVEVLKTRVHKEGNPDYWEPSRPLVKYKMEKMDKNPKKEELDNELRSKTRWNPIEKEVVYLDFRHEALSAYDKFFYCTALNSVTWAFKSKQDFIRRYSKNLKRVIDEGLNDYKIYKKKILENRLLDKCVVKIISEVLNRDYLNIRIIKHTFYTSEPAKTVLLTTRNGTDYSEAFAGSGEFSVVCLIDAISRASEKSLILLDEPEVSIHPDAQKKLMIFLAQQVLNKKFQVVIATHSPYLTKDLPNNAIKLLRLDDNGSVDVENKVYPSEIFVEIGTAKSQLIVVVEDACAKTVLEACLRNCNKDKYFSVHSATRFGAEGILSHDAVTNFTEGVSHVVYCLDGDKKKDFPKITNDLKQLKEAVKKIAPGVILCQSNAPESLQIDKYKKFLEYLECRLFYLPDQFGPEEIVWNVLSDESKSDIQIDLDDKYTYKNAIKEACAKHFKSDNGDSIAKFIEFNSMYILCDQRKTIFDEKLNDLVCDLMSAFNELVEG